MNFGVGAGDVLSVTMLAYKLYRRCSDSGTEFKRISEDVRNLYIVLHDIDETVKEDNTGLSRTGFERLERVKKDARGVLEELSLELKKFESLDTKSMRKWDVIRWGLKDVSDIRSRLTSITTNLNMYFHSLSNGANSRIEKIVTKVLYEVQRGFHEGSVISNATTDSLNTKETWAQLRKELEEAGIDASVLNDKDKRAFIIGLIMRAKSDGAIDEVDLAGIDEGSEFDTDLSTTRTLIDEEYQQRLDRLKCDDEDGEPLEHRRSANAPKRPSKRRLGSFLLKFMGNDLRIIEAADQGDLETMLKLIKAKVNIQTQDKWHWTALHMAAYGGYEEMTKVLIEESADLDARTVDDETPRHLAEMKGRVGVVRIIEEEEIRRARRKQSSASQALTLDGLTLSGARKSDSLRSV